MNTPSETVQAVASARRNLLRHQPFLASIVLQQDIRIQDDVPERTIATSGKTLLINPKFFTALSPEEQVYALAHCAWHCALLHPWRRGERDVEIWDMACDIEAYIRLRDESGMVCPSQMGNELCQLADALEGETAEEIYDELASWKKLKIPKSGIDQHLDGQSQTPSSSTCDGPADRSKNHLEQKKSSSGRGSNFPDGNMDSSDSGGAEGNSGNDSADGDYASSPPEGLDKAYEVIDMIKSANENSKRLASNCKTGLGAGHAPGCVEELLDSIRPPSQDWRVLLGDYVKKCHAEQRRWYPPSRRHIWRGVYLPSIQSERLNAVVAIDTSGSTCPYVERFFSEMLGIVRSVCSQYEITLIECDYDIQNVQQLTEFSQMDKNRKWKVHGLGGTSFAPVFDYVKDKFLMPDVLVFFTDGCGKAPDEAPDYPVIWCLPDEENMTAPSEWGKKIRIPVDSLTH